MDAYATWHGVGDVCLLLLAGRGCARKLLWQPDADVDHVSAQLNTVIIGHAPAIGEIVSELQSVVDKLYASFYLVSPANEIVTGLGV